MHILRTPDDRFHNLPGFPYTPHYVDVGQGLRMAYIDEGAGEETVLCLHGEPTWSFLYRHIIAALSPHYRVVAPDLIGFGRSDKPAELEDYSYHMHHDTLAAFILALDLHNITLVCQDWGGILGLPLATEMPERFARLVIMNTGLPTGERPMGEGFMQWYHFAKRSGRELLPGQLVRVSARHTQLSDEVIAAYDAPFPDASYRAGVATFPLLIPQQPDAPGAAEIRAARDALKSWDKAALVMFSDSDPVTAGGDRFFRRLIPTAAEQPEIVIREAGHFLQEEQGPQVAEQVRAFIERTKN